MFENTQIGGPVGTLARAEKTIYGNVVSHTRRRRAAADLEGFAHSAAAMGRGQQEQGQTHTMMNAESDCDDAVL